MKTLYCLGMLAVASLSFGQVLNANPTANNGSGGIFMQFTAVNSVSLTSFDTFVSTGTGAANIEFWTRSGPYTGFTASNAGWTLHDTATIGDSENNTLVNVNMADINIAAGDVLSVYMHATSRGIRYFGTGSTSNTNFSNADLLLFTNISRTGTVAFGGSQFTPRALAGNVNYTVVPEPMTMVAMGAGLLALARRRRAK